MDMHKLIENNGEGSKMYNSIFVDPSKINILSNKLTLEIIVKLSENKACAMDLSRSLKQHEQKIYYHLRKLEQAGVIKQVGTEQRYGMVAKMYSPASPVVALKLYDDGQVVNSNMETVKNHEVLKLLEPFIENGELNAKIIMGYPYPHGKYDSNANEGAHYFDFALFIGKLVGKTSFPSYKFDVDINESDLNENLILFGNQKTNTILDKFNMRLPVTFSEGGEVFTSKTTEKLYKDPNIGFIIKCDNPINPSKKILWIGGIRSRGAHSAVIAVTQNFNKILKQENFVKIVTGLDKDGDKIIDSIKILE